MNRTPVPLLARRDTERQPLPLPRTTLANCSPEEQRNNVNRWTNRRKHGTAKRIGSIEVRRILKSIRRQKDLVEHLTARAEWDVRKAKGHRQVFVSPNFVPSRSSVIA